LLELHDAGNWRSAGLVLLSFQPHAAAMRVCPSVSCQAGLRLCRRHTTELSLAAPRPRDVPSPRLRPLSGTRAWLVARAKAPPSQCVPSTALVRLNCWDRRVPTNPLRPLAPPPLRLSMGREVVARMEAALVVARMARSCVNWRRFSLPLLLRCGRRGPVTLSLVAVRHLLLRALREV